MCVEDIVRIHPLQVEIRFRYFIASSAKTKLHVEV